MAWLGYFSLYDVGKITQIYRVWFHPTTLDPREKNHLDEAGIEPVSSRSASDRSIRYTTAPRQLRGSWYFYRDGDSLLLASADGYAAFADNLQKKARTVANAMNALQACIYKSVKTGLSLKSFEATSIVQFKIIMLFC